MVDDTPPPIFSSPQWNCEKRMMNCIAIMGHISQIWEYSIIDDETRPNLMWAWNNANRGLNEAVEELRKLEQLEDSK